MSGPTPVSSNLSCRSGQVEETMSSYSGGRWAASCWATSVGALLFLGGCGGETPTDPALVRSGGLALASEAVPFHDHGVDLSFSGGFPCADAGIDVEATFDYHIIVDVSFFPQRNVFRIFPRDVVLTHTNVETGETVVQVGGFIEIYDNDAGTATFIERFKVRGSDGEILLKFAGRLVFDADGNLIFEAGQHPGFEPDFLTFVCTALS
jgi:hypothetical protein